MTKSYENHWYPVGMLSGITGSSTTLLLGKEIAVGRNEAGCFVRDSAGHALPAVERFGHLWTSPGQPSHDLFTIPETDAPGRRRVDVGSVRLRKLEAHLTEQRFDRKKFLVGETPTIADIACFPNVALAPDGGVSLDVYPSIHLWMRAIRSLPRFIEMPGIHRLHELEA